LAAGAQAYLINPDDLQQLGPTAARLVKEYESRSGTLRASYNNAA